ncbi:MAG: protein kinase [Gemmataceae bacterium]
MNASLATARRSLSHLVTLPARGLLDRIQRTGLLDASEISDFLGNRLDRLREYTSEERLGQAFIQANLLTAYQLQRLLAGTTHGLVLGSYRICDEIGRGGMGTVYLAEHGLMKRRVAIKVLPVEEDLPSAIKQRFCSEMRVLAELSHPNIVLAIDAGEVPGGTSGPPLIYMVMEYVEGGDLEKYVLRQGVLEIGETCKFICQAAAGLQAAHDRHLVHRDIKPSNLMITRNKVVKLVDFGLARQFASRLTDQRALLGSVEFMPPEQSHDPSLVGKSADIYGLGATLFWLLTGEGPHPHQPHVGHALRMLQEKEPRRLRDLRPETPVELDAVVASMLARDPDHRPASPLAVINALRPFTLEGPRLAVGAPLSRRELLEGDRIFRALIVDDELRVRLLHHKLLEEIGCECVEVRTGQAALEAVEQAHFDLVLLDLSLSDMEGYEVCRRLRERGDASTLKIIVVSGVADQDDLAESLPRGADDYVAKPFKPSQLLAKVRHALQLKSSQDRAQRLAEQLQQANHQLEESLRARNADLEQAHDALLFAMAKIAESRDGETPGHLRRMQLYSMALAREAAHFPPWQGLVDARFLEQLERCVPLHDVGKISLPDEILLKPASLTAAERQQVNLHPILGDQILEALGREHGAALEFLGMARVIVRHHHERYDGRGYPDGLSGDAIPPAARLVAVADVYDALRRMRLYKPAMSHTAAMRTIVERSPGQFDPTLVAAFQRCHGEFERIYQQIEE